MATIIGNSSDAAAGPKFTDGSNQVQRYKSPEIRSDAVYHGQSMNDTNVVGSKRGVTSILQSSDAADQVGKHKRAKKSTD
jgi:hypothetical protein